MVSSNLFVMKEYLIYMLILISVSLNSCKESEKKNNQNKNIPDAFTDKSVINSVEFKRYNKNTIDRLFEEYLESDTSLKQEIEIYHEKIKKLNNDLEEFNKYNSNNTSYYTSAYLSVSSVSDSVLSKTLFDKLNLSQINYHKRIIEWNQLNLKIDSVRRSINDILITIKVNKTLEMVEQYQKSNIPEPVKVKNDLNEMIKIKNALEKNLK